MLNATIGVVQQSTQPKLYLKKLKLKYERFLEEYLLKLCEMSETNNMNHFWTILEVNSNMGYK